MNISKTIEASTIAMNYGKRRGKLGSSIYPDK